MRANRVVAFLGVTCVLLGGLLAWLLLAPLKPIPTIVASAVHPGASSAKSTPLKMAEFGAYDEISKRPLFTPTRRPAPIRIAIPAPPVQQPRALPSIVLLGTILDGSERIAFVRLAGEPHGQAIRLRETVGDWIVTQIQLDQLILESGSLKHAVSLQGAGPAVPAPRLPIAPAAKTPSNQIRR